MWPKGGKRDGWDKEKEIGNELITTRNPKTGFGRERWCIWKEPTRVYQNTEVSGMFMVIEV